jgi:hypothetical protein
MAVLEILIAVEELLYLGLIHGRWPALYGRRRGGAPHAGAESG